MFVLNMLFRVFDLSDSSMTFGLGNKTDIFDSEILLGHYACILRLVLIFDLHPHSSGCLVVMESMSSICVIPQRLSVWAIKLTYSTVKTAEPICLFSTCILMLVVSCFHILCSTKNHRVACRSLNQFESKKKGVNVFSFQCDSCLGNISDISDNYILQTHCACSQHAF